MAPRQDFMFCTIPSYSAASREIKSTALIRLLNGNASYVVRHFSAPSTMRDLDITTKGPNPSINGTFAQLRKKLLEFEQKGINLGWRAIGVRRMPRSNHFRGTFILETPTTYWPWSFTFDHPHGSINQHVNLLNFDPSWSAAKPYACQICYNSDHHTMECSLNELKIGGIPIISYSTKQFLQ